MANNQASENKQKFGDTLYALQTELSILSEIQNEAKPIEQSIQDAKQRIEDLKEKQNVAKNRAKRELEDYYAKLKKKQEDIPHYKTLITEFENKSQVASREHNGYRILSRIALGALIATILVIIIGLRLSSVLESENILTGFIGTACIPLIVAIICWLEIRIHSKDYTAAKENIKNSQQKIADTQKNLSSAQNELDDLIINKESTLASITQHQNKILQDIDHQIQAIEDEVVTNKNNLHPIIDHYNTKYKTIKEQFGAFLDERDWENIDLIIFNYETGRALNLRDALLQIDNDQCNKRLAHAVRASTSAITSSLQREFGSLKIAMDIQFSNLDQSIADFSHQIEYVTNAFTRQQQEFDKHLSRITELSSTQQELLKKINTSNDKMTGNITHMKDMADRVYQDTYHRTF